MTKAKTTSKIRLPIEPLLALVEMQAGVPVHSRPCTGCGNNVAQKGGCLRPNDIARLCNVSERSVLRWYTAGLRLDKADEVATWLGWHPATIWGPNWDVFDEDDDG